MIICKGDGTLMFNPKNGDVVWAEVCSPMSSWCKDNGYKDTTCLELQLNLIPKVMTLPICIECPRYTDCISTNDAEELNNMYCTAINEKATSIDLLRALAALTPDERAELLGEGMDECE